MSPGSTGDPGPSREEDGREKGNEQSKVCSLAEYKQEELHLLVMPGWTWCSEEQGMSPGTESVLMRTALSAQQDCQQSKDTLTYHLWLLYSIKFCGQSIPAILLHYFLFRPETISDRSEIFYSHCSLDCSGVCDASSPHHPKKCAFPSPLTSRTLFCHH